MKLAQQMAESGDVEGAWKRVNELMMHDPTNPHLLILASYCMQKAGNWGVAYHLAKASIEGLPKRPEPLINLSSTCDQLYLMKEGLEACDKSYKLSDTDALRGTSLMNKASLLINHGRFKEALPISESAAKIKQNDKSHGNLGMCQLAMGNWAEGWDNYSRCLGTSERARIDYGVPDWDGTTGKTVIVYGEQGIGDEISFASVLPDFLNENAGIIDCDYRLKGLFERSFPAALVNGGRWAKKYKGEADYQCAIGELSKFYRRKDEDFPRKPYLKADPLRASQWKHLKETTGKPLVGIAWTGGMAHTGSKFRNIEKHIRSDILGNIDATFVSLEYKERGKINGVDVYPHATLTEDYDDTAALVSQCDVIITVQTAVAHLAGALGIPCVVLVPETSQWRYSAPNFLWYTENFHVHKAPWDIKEVIEIAKRYI